MLVGIVLSALPREPIPAPFSAGQHQERHTSTTTVTDEAETVFRLGEGAGLPDENAVLHAHCEENPDGLLGAQDGYSGKSTFGNRRIDGGTVARPDPGGARLGGVSEVFPEAAGAAAATARGAWPAH